MMKRILFQGDSITDVFRVRDLSTVNYIDYGRGYPLRVAGRLDFEEPCTYEYFNRGISGNRIVDVYARLKADIINLKPDIMSFLVGVNDVWHDINYQNGVDTAKFEKIYCMMIEEIKEALPDIRIMIMEPFVMAGSATVGVLDGGVDRLDLFREGVAEKAAAARRVAEKYGLVFIPTQEKLNKLCTLMPPSYWTMDGVHPTPFGHEFLAEEWLAAFRANYQ